METERATQGSEHVRQSLMESPREASAEEGPDVDDVSSSSAARGKKEEGPLGSFGSFVAGFRRGNGRGRRRRGERERCVVPGHW